MRAKPTKKARDATHAATSEDYAKLSEAVIRAIILRQKDLYISLPYFVRFADDFPRGICTQKTDKNNVYKTKTYKVAAWLHMHGHLAEDAHGVMLAMRQLTYKEAAINKLLVDSGKENLYNDGIGTKEDKEDKIESNDES